MLTVAVPKWNILQKIIVLTPKDGKGLDIFITRRSALSRPPFFIM